MKIETFGWSLLVMGILTFVFCITLVVKEAKREAEREKKRLASLPPEPTEGSFEDLEAKAQKRMKRAWNAYPAPGKSYKEEREERYSDRPRGPMCHWYGEF